MKYRCSEQPPNRPETCVVPIPVFTYILSLDLIPLHSADIIFSEVCEEIAFD